MQAVILNLPGKPTLPAVLVKLWFAAVNGVSWSVCAMEWWSIDHFKQFAARAFMLKDFSCWKNQLEKSLEIKSFIKENVRQTCILFITRETTFRPGVIFTIKQPEVITAKQNSIILFKKCMLEHFKVYICSLYFHTRNIKKNTF